MFWRDCGGLLNDYRIEKGFRVDDVSAAKRRCRWWSLWMFGVPPLSGLYGSAIVQSLCNGGTERCGTPVLFYTLRPFRSPIAHGCWDCTRIALESWIAACAGFVFVADGLWCRNWNCMVIENRSCLSARPWPSYRSCTEIVGLPWIAEPSHSAISSSIILTLFLPLELRELC